LFIKNPNFPDRQRTTERGELLRSVLAEATLVAPKQWEGHYAALTPQSRKMSVDESLLDDL
jgi:hypothetical protein